MTLGASFIEKGAGAGVVNQGFTYGAGSGVTSLTWTHSDVIGPTFTSTAIGAWIIPEPSRALLSLVGIAAMGLRRRRIYSKLL